MAKNGQKTEQFVLPPIDDLHAHVKTSAFERFLSDRLSTIILWICIIAAIRVFLFSAAFPFFNNVDEPAHMDLVSKYARGHVPSSMENFGSESSQFILLYGSPEFLHTPGEYSGYNYPSPLWSVLNKNAAESLPRMAGAMRRMTNHESTQQPLYYYLAGRWHELGVFLGLDGGQLLYWLRFMNVIIYAMLVMVSFGFVRRFYPENFFLQLGVPLMLAAFPQDVFYSINNDVPSALLFTLALFGLLEIYRSKSITYMFAACTGLMAAATMLTKFSNISILLALAAVLILKVLGLRSAGIPKKGLLQLAVLLLAAFLPIALWMARNYFLMNDLTGSMLKTEILGWEPKPFMQMFHHPIFSASGCGFFFAELTRTLWRGEFFWKGARMAAPGSDMFYVITTGLFLAAGMFAMFIKKWGKAATERIADRMGVLVIAASVGFLILMSIAFDFGSCCYPSRELPYMTSGRLMLGALVPLFILYLNGLDFILSKLRLARFRYGVLLILFIVICVADTVLSIGAFGSKFNWFHMISI